MLSLAAVPHQVMPAEVSEEPGPKEQAEAFTRRVAGMKAEAVARQVPLNKWVLAADTIVVVDDVILGKPRDLEDAARMLRLLSGRSHRVLTAVVLVKAGDGTHTEFLAETQVRFHTLSQEWIQGYIQTGEPLDKAGAYGIQGQGGILVHSIQGSYTNVVGLPLSETVRMLEKASIWKAFSPPNQRSTAQAAAGGEA